MYLLILRHKSQSYLGRFFLQRKIKGTILVISEVKPPNRLISDVSKSEVVMFCTFCLSLLSIGEEHTHTQTHTDLHTYTHVRLHTPRALTSNHGRYCSAAEQLGLQQIKWTFAVYGNTQQDEQDNNVQTGDWLDPGTQPLSRNAVSRSRNETCFPGYKQLAFLRAAR